MKTTTTNDIVKAISPVREKGGALKAILFGSYARGDADEYSDVDLIIIAESNRPFVERAKDFSNLWNVSPVKAIDVLVYTPAEFQEMLQRENPFVVRAVEEGKVIYEA